MVMMMWSNLMLDELFIISIVDDVLNQNKAFIFFELSNYTGWKKTPERIKDEWIVSLVKRVTANPLVFRSHLKRSHSPFSICSIYQSRWTCFIILVHSPFPFISSVIRTMHRLLYVCMIAQKEWETKTTKWQSNEMNHDSVESSQQPFFYLRFVHIIARMDIG